MEFINDIKKRLKERPYLNNLVYTFLFGGLSLVLGELKFFIPGYEGGASDFREIALIIGIFYIRNPFYIIGLCLITLINIPPEVSYISTFLMHIVALLAAYLFFTKLETYRFSNVIRGALWMVFVLIYYALFIVPTLILANYWVGISDNLNFNTTYLHLIETFRFEIITTSLVTGLFYIQFKERGDLVEHKKNLERTVHERTKEIEEANYRLIDMNEELLSSSEQIKAMNENLDDLVKERSRKIKDQLQLLVRYAHMNSHDVRAPLARILGLLYLIEKEDEGSPHIKVILGMLYESSIELDNVVKSMNRLLEKEIVV